MSGTQLKSPRYAARRLRINHWNRDGKMRLPVDPVAIATDLGIEVHFAILDASTAGFIIREGSGPTEIYINVADHEFRRRFTLAHELGHYVQHEGEPEIGFVDKRDELSTTGTDPSEVWANQFAAELLMPEAVLKRWWAEGRTPTDIRKKLQVSLPALTNRLTNLGLLSE